MQVNPLQQAPIYNFTVEDRELIGQIKVTSVITALILDYLAEFQNEVEIDTILWERFNARIWREEITVIYLGINGVIHNAKRTSQDQFNKSYILARKENPNVYPIHQSLKAEMNLISPFAVHQFQSFLQEIIGKKVIVITSELKNGLSTRNLRWALSKHYFSVFIIGKTVDHLNEDQKWSNYTNSLAPYYIQSDDEIKNRAAWDGVNSPNLKQWALRREVFEHRTIKIIDYITTHPLKPYVIFDNNPMGDYNLSSSVIYKNPFGARFIYVDSQDLFSKIHSETAFQALYGKFEKKFHFAIA